MNIVNHINQCCLMDCIFVLAEFSSLIFFENILKIFSCLRIFSTHITNSVITVFLKLWGKHLSLYIITLKIGTKQFQCPIWNLVMNFFGSLPPFVVYWFTIFIASTSFFNRQKFRMYTHTRTYPGCLAYFQNPLVPHFMWHQVLTIIHVCSRSFLKHTLFYIFSTCKSRS